MYGLCKNAGFNPFALFTEAANQMRSDIGNAVNDIGNAVDQETEKIGKVAGELKANMDRELAAATKTLKDAEDKVTSYVSKSWRAFASTFDSFFAGLLSKKN